MKNLYLSLLVVSLAIVPAHLFAHSGACDTKKRDVFPTECSTGRVTAAAAASGIVGSVVAKPACIELKYRKCKEDECMPAYNAALSACNNKPWRERKACKQHAEENYKNCFNNVAVRGY